MRASLRSICFALPALALATDLGAQRVLGPGDDAVTLPRGIVRTTILVENQLFRGRWNEGRSEGLGGGFSVSALGAPHLSWLDTLDDAASGIGVTGLNASLGSTFLNLRQRYAVTRLGVEYGLTNRLTLSVNAPFVRSRVEALLRARTDSGLATAGVNPIALGSAVAGSNRTTIDRYTSAATSLTARRTDCEGNAAAHPECPTILAEAAQVAGLIAQANQFAAGLGSIYGGTGVGNGLPFVPLAGSLGEQALLQQVAALRDAFTRYGVADITPSTGLPLGAQTPLSNAQLVALVTGDSIGYGVEPMTSTARQNLGDVDFALRFTLRDDFAGDSARFAANTRGIRQTIGVAYRLGGGLYDLPDNFIDLPTGSGHDAVALRSYTDLVWNEKSWATVMVGVGKGFGYERTVRVPDAAGIAWLEPWRTSVVQIAPAAVLELRVAPRWVINEYFQLGGEWRWRSKGEDAHTIATPDATTPQGAAVTLSSAALDRQSAWNEHRWGWQLAYSTLAAAARGRARARWEVGYTHEQSIGSSVGIVPRRWEDRVQIRIYSGRAR